ncbi:MAG: hypothetical protein ACI9JN_001941 [Bacteroidia bacterium]|jgi:hypothetical protein
MKINNNMFWVKSLIITVLLSLSCTIASAQTRGFSKNPEIFIGELGDHVKKLNDKSVVKTYDVFKEQWESGVYTEDQEGVVIRLAEYMALKKFKINPDFELYMRTLVAGKDSNSGVSEEKFNNWLLNQYKLIKKNRRSYLVVLKTSYGLFKSNILYADKSKDWRFSKTDYKFEYTGNNVFLNLTNVDIICHGPDDSLIVRETSGQFNILTKQWKGSNGIIDWERVGISAVKAFAEFDDYTIDMTTPGLKIDTVMFQYKGMLDGKIPGSLEDKVSARTIHRKGDDFQDSKFPKYISFSDDLTIKSFESGNIVFKGGFAMEGSRMQGRGSPENKAVFEFYYEGKLIVEVKANIFTISDGKIQSQQTEATIFTDSGQIYHPRVQLSFDEKDKRLALLRGQKGIEQAPFFDSDHNIEIMVDQIIWKMEEPKIDFDMLIDEERALFMSKNYFKEYNYEKITRGNMMRYHPIDKLYKFYMTFRTKKLSLEDYAGYLNSKKENLYPQVIGLADAGFIYYDTETEQIEIKEKLLNYYKNHWKLADYDIIRFSSVIAKKPNATLNLVNYDLEIQGVRAFQFSDSQYVIAYPREQFVRIKNNRRLQFDGKVTAGRFDFFGDEFDFSYENFTIVSEKIDSLKLWFPDNVNQKFLIPVKSVLRDINGIIYIDKSNNKSGLTDYPEYPRFVSRAPSVIAYDKKTIHNGTYNKDEFRFEVDPFDIDSLDNFTIAGLKFPGNFVSGGILPEFRFEASIMEDYSLGFTKANPPGGYPLYDGKGHGEIDISMSEEGFYAKGTIDYEGAKLESNNILMTPDSTNADVDVYEIKRSEKYPRLYATDVMSHWLPKEDQMYINTKQHEVDIFDDGQVFEGNLLQTPNRLSGNGELRWDNAVLASADMHFNAIHADADVSRIKIGDVDAGMISFVSTNVNSHVDFEKRTGDFRANEMGHLTQFPYNQFASTMDEFKWDMDKKTILLTPTGRQNKKEYVFKSQNPSQHGLVFQSTKALFDMNTGIIYADEVPYIDVADSRIFPSDGKVIIEKDAVLRPLEKAKLLANRDNKYHELYDCKLWVEGRLSISGNGFYVFKDKYKTGQIIYLDKMRVMNDTSTIQASGYISDSIGFAISPKIGYKGTADLSSKEAYLSFKGFVKPLHTYKDIKSQWFRYLDQPDPTNVIVSATEPRNIDRRKVDIGISLSPSDSVAVYPTFFSQKYSFTDQNLTIDTGVFFYDELTKAFVVGDSNKLLNGAIRGNIMTMSDNAEDIRAEGVFDFGLDLHENFKAITVGEAVRNEGDSTFTFKTLMALDMELPEECWLRMQEIFSEKVSDAPSYSVDDATVKRNIAELVTDKKKYDKVTLELEEFGQIKQITELKKDLMITNLEFYYSHTLGAFVSKTPINLATLHGKQINKQLNAYVIIEKRRSGTRIALYFEVTKYDYFYFEYQRGNVFVYSTDKDFNLILRQRASKVNERGYTVRAGSPLKVTKHIDIIDGLDE